MTAILIILIILVSVWSIAGAIIYGMFVWHEGFTKVADAALFLGEDKQYQDVERKDVPPNILRAARWLVLSMFGPLVWIGVSVYNLALIVGKVAGKALKPVGIFLLHTFYYSLSGRKPPQ